MVRSRWSHYLLIGLVWAVAGLPNLGGPSLWDIDEGNNAEAAREMLLADNWVVPNFNFRLREDKPALLYWCQILAYRTFGVNEFSARLPSALAVLLTALVTYELGRAMFTLVAGLLAGVATPMCLLICGAGHFANPDALLLLSLTLAFAFFWAHLQGHRLASLGVGIAIGIGLLAKGPVALVMPLGVFTLFLIWQGRWRELFRPGWLLGLSAWMVVALPWYIWVTLETRGAWLSGFWFRHNSGRFLEAMETHGGPIVYYIPVVLIGLAPWSLFLIPALIDVCRGMWQPAESSEDERRRDATRFLIVWAGAYFAFFSLAATKLPNYVLPIYPALLLLIADRLDRWRGGEALARWVVPSVVVAQLLVALGFFFGAPLAGGTFLPGILRGKHLPGMEHLAILGIVPLLAAGIGLWLYRRRMLSAYLVAFTAFGVLATAILAGAAPILIEPHKAIKQLAGDLPADHLDREVRILCHNYFQPSLVFYTHRMVELIPGHDAVIAAMRGPQTVYVLMPAGRWEELRGTCPGREVSRRHDLYRRLDVALVTNDPQPGQRLIVSRSQSRND